MRPRSTNVKAKVTSRPQQRPVQWFKGSAAIEDGEIHGRFEGNLVVRKRLLIKASGRVSVTIRYGQIEIECGGQISGEIQAHPSPEPELKTTDGPNARAASRRQVSPPPAGRGGGLRQ